MIENNGHVHLFSTGTESGSPLGSQFFQKHKSSVNLVICCKFYPLNDFVTFLPIQAHKRPNFILP